MPRSLLARAVTSLLLGALAVYLWQQVFPSEETRIRRQLDRIADEANELGTDLSAVAAAARLMLHFTEDVTIDPGNGIAPLRGRETIMAIARGMGAKGQAHVEIKGTDVTLTPDRQSAAVTLTVTLTRDAGAGKESLDARELALTMVKRDSAWLISHVTSVDTLR